MLYASPTIIPLKKLLPDYNKTSLVFIARILLKFPLLMFFILQLFGRFSMICHIPLRTYNQNLLTSRYLSHTISFHYIAPTILNS